MLLDILEHAGADALVLLDETGTGTDPAEGAALAGAALRALTARGTVTIASTPLGALKELAGHEPGVVNASLQFDAATLTPTFRFVKGVPGRSYGLAIARRLGVDADVLAEAERTLPEGGRRLDQIIEVRVQLGSAPCDIERRNIRGGEEGQDALHGLPAHHLGSGRTGLDVTVNAGLVAVLAHVDLQDIDSKPVEAVTV